MIRLRVKAGVSREVRIESARKQRVSAMVDLYRDVIT